mmetsp:Transcript_34367/g.70875  ORF Transcript_34367/g.70875 Transcript_34367/m.70875 type:complete len:324 (+) Transcript_34367:216-1187(+)|eukprot:CAMPEP_0181306664 /NCGR_PEP_ID=MMETSP1101-20121128/10431_1 /TAXON_ID=46948 /ORGANISM="Rhodomonas abbreviata, Strain Caron Lab Isolate" /LENGTH=323 /DNA_ID=CAMNT_0023412757 /DNA_START=304 /DNA_END=1275 /DNA_ORIENTATION=+
MSGSRDLPSRGANRHDSAKKSDTISNMVSATIVGAQFGAAKAFGDSSRSLLSALDDSLRADGASTGQKHRNSMASVRSSGSFRDSFGSRSSSVLSECYAAEGPIHQSPASLESMSPTSKRGSPQGPIPVFRSRPSPLDQRHADAAGRRAEKECDTSPKHSPSRWDDDGAYDSGDDDAPSQPSKPFSGEGDDMPSDTSSLADLAYCTGIKWFVRNNKLVVGSFSGWSVADKMGVKHGDILQGVDGVNVLHLHVDEDGGHPAMDLLLGPYGSQCKLSLMRVDTAQVQALMKRAQEGKSSFSTEKLELRQLVVSVPRLIRKERPSE